MNDKVSIVIGCVLTAVFATIFVVAWDWPLEASLFPLLTSGLGVVFCTVFVCIEGLRYWHQRHAQDSVKSATPSAGSVERRQEIIALAWVLTFFAAVGLSGFQWGLPAAMLVYYLFEARLAFASAVLTAAGGWAFLYLMRSLLNIPLYEGYLFGLLR